MFAGWGEQQEQRSRFPAAAEQRTIEKKQGYNYNRFEGIYSAE
jgi:hypothetical protein